MTRITGIRRAAILGLAGLFGVAAVAGVIGSKDWAIEVDAVELNNAPSVEAVQPGTPLQPAEGPRPDRGGDDEAARKLEDDDPELDPSDDGDDRDDSTNDVNTGDGDGTRGDDGTSGGNNTGDGANSNTGGRTTG